MNRLICLMAVLLSQALSVDSQCLEINSDGVLVDGTTCTGDITIPKDVVEIGAEAFLNNKNLLSVTFEPGSKLTTIGNKAFQGVLLCIGIVVMMSCVCPQSGRMGAVVTLKLAS